jgi:hypothetical protein
VKGSSNMASPNRRLRDLSSVCMILCGVSCAETTPPVTAEVSPTPSQLALEPHQFLQSGFPPLSEATAQGREVRRAAFEPSYVIRGVELERRSDGSVVLWLVSPFVKSDPVSISQESWTRLVATEDEVFRPATTPAATRNPPRDPSEPPPSPPPPSRPPPICHGFSAFIAATGARGERYASASTCNPGTPQLRYANEIARIAVETDPDCEFDESEPLISFAACFVRRLPDAATPQS